MPFHEELITVFQGRPIGFDPTFGFSGSFSDTYQYAKDFAGPGGQVYSTQVPKSIWEKGIQAAIDRGVNPAGARLGIDRYLGEAIAKAAKIIGDPSDELAATGGATGLSRFIPAGLGTAATVGGTVLGGSLLLGGDVPRQGSSLAERYGIGTPPDPNRASALRAQATLRRSAARFSDQLPSALTYPGAAADQGPRALRATESPTTLPSFSRRFSPRVPRRIAGGRRGSFTGGPVSVSPYTKRFSPRVPRRIAGGRRPVFSSRLPLSPQKRTPARVGPRRSKPKTFRGFESPEVKMVGV